MDPTPNSRWRVVDCRGTRISATSDNIETVLKLTGLDAIVSSDDSRLSMGGGVSAAIAKLAGPEMVAEAAARIPLPVGSLAVTSAGALPLKYVFHAVTVDWANLIMPSERTIEQVAREIFVRCEALGVRRIAIPALATGAAGFSPEVSARLVVQRLFEHLNNPSVLQEVVFSLPDPAARNAFAAALRAAEPEVDEQPGALRSNRVIVCYGPERREELLREFAARVVGARPADPPPEASFERLSDLNTIPPTFPVARPPISAQTESIARPVIQGRYVLLEEIGRGGFGVVHLSWDLVLRRVIAIKVLREGVAEPQSLKNEAAIAIDLTHEGIVRVHHFEPACERFGPFMVMEYLPWSTGEKWIADSGTNGLPARSALEVGVRLAEALAYAHDRKVLHLDIKPGNIFVDPAGEGVKLADFGLARVLAGQGARALQLKPAGTPAYMAPEQMKEGSKVSPLTDVYQLAATLWDFIAGEPPRPDGRVAPLVPLERRRFLEPLKRALSPDADSRPSARQFGGLLRSALDAA